MPPKRRVSDGAPRPKKRARGTASQPIAIDSQPSQYTHTFESRLRESQPEDAIAAPTDDGSEQATIVPSDAHEDEAFDAHLEDNFDGIDWSRLPRYTKPIATFLHKKSWVYRHGYRVAHRKHPTRIFWICHWCHKHKLTDIGRGVYNTSSACSAAARHLSEDKPGHRILAPGKTSVGVYNALTAAKIPISQAVANQISGFSNQRSRYAVVEWLVANNHPISELETPAFRRLVAIANPLAEKALWKSHNSVSRYIIQLFDWRSATRERRKSHTPFEGLEIISM
ncbi:hypothetical protein BU23DRAFT_593786 [Bimuria novae-zelandiae CBS 107.79]|uniref:Uncharacterized protein n=1 Tax=Bimuria novae-zelandiae CBS 107.79 TaxID=1447943 RepID=A0A6A5UKC2_9PLEO|nr:hypothetical protein BU23DRAFT_593786 [Bimuria novae-zelandiae CBS 107.79]